jgi:LuxR family transcriptional regulator, maltose regulon positive regulatory protein
MMNHHGTPARDRLGHLASATGSPDASLWAEATRRWQVLGFPQQVIHTSWRHAEAHLADVRGQPVAAHDALIKALDRAAPINARRDLAHASDRVRSLLSTHRDRLGRHEAFVRHVIQAIHKKSRSSGGMSFVAGEALTERELDLLRDLPSLLSLTEIAEAHVVSLNTVKTHLKAINRKLDVASRREAVERARALGLI